jgi:iron complex transport system substrate-binding protein
MTGPRVLLCVGRDGLGSGSITKAWLAGPTTFYGELLNAAGARNAITDSVPSYPTFSGEAILRSQPDVIVDLMASMAGIDSGAARRDWNSLAVARAVREGMIFCLTGDYLTIPGPRIVQTVKELKRIVGEYGRKRNTEQ